MTVQKLQHTMVRRVMQGRSPPVPPLEALEELRHLVRKRIYSQILVLLQQGVLFGLADIISAGADRAPSADRFRSTGGTKDGESRTSSSIGKSTLAAIRSAFVGVHDCVRRSRDVLTSSRANANGSWNEAR